MNSQHEYMPDIVSPPGDTLLEMLEERGMKQVELATRTGRAKRTINEIIKGKAPISPETALLFERVLGAPASFWNNRERNYRENLARQAERNSLQGQLDWLNQFPIKAMVNFGWLPEVKEPVEMFRMVLNFFGIASPIQWQEIWREPSVAFRKSPAFESDPFAVSVWIRQGEIEAHQIHCSDYDEKRFVSALQSIRALTAQLPKNFTEEVVRLCADAGVAAVFVPQLPKVRVSGATRWLSKDKALLQVSLRYKTDDQLWFSFFHEAGHILKHGKRDVFIDGNGEDSEKEREAHRFSADFLLPPAEYNHFESRGRYYSKAEIAEFAKEIGIAPGIVVGRLQHDGKLPHKNCNDLKISLQWANE